MHRSSVFLSIGIEGYGIPVLEAIRLGTPVLFDGIQPAGDLMVGRGARRVPAMTQEDLVRLFSQHGDEASLAAVRAELDPSGVPTWSAFTQAVATALVEAWA